MHKLHAHQQHAINYKVILDWLYWLTKYTNKECAVTSHNMATFYTQHGYILHTTWLHSIHNMATFYTQHGYIQHTIPIIAVKFQLACNCHLHRDGSVEYRHAVQFHCILHVCVLCIYSPIAYVWFLKEILLNDLFLLFFIYKRSWNMLNLEYCFVQKVLMSSIVVAEESNKQRGRWKI